METNNTSFSYSYSAKDREEIEKIRKKYSPDVVETENKMQRLRRLDKKAEQQAKAIALSLGVIGSLILGTGMSIVMTDLGEALGLGAAASAIVGGSIGTVGMIICAIAYPVYKKVIEKVRKKLAPEIIALSDELLN